MSWRWRLHHPYFDTPFILLLIVFAIVGPFLTRSPRGTGASPQPSGFIEKTQAVQQSPKTSKSSTFEDLPPAKVIGGYPAIWRHLTGFNVVVYHGVSVLNEQPILNLTNVDSDKLHRIGVRLSGTPVGKSLLATAWLKPKTDTPYFAFEIADDASVRYAAAVYNLFERRVVWEAPPGQITSITETPDGWVKATLGFQSSDGTVILMIRTLDVAKNWEFTGDGLTGVLYGGFEIESQRAAP